MFDSQCDVAAIVYSRKDDPDGLLQEFVTDLKRLGFRLTGLIQCARVFGSAADHVSFMMLPEDAIVRLAHNIDGGPGGCGLAPNALIEAASSIALAISRGADLLIVNRFGKMEVEGRGLVDEICQAIVADIPVLVTVPEQHFTTWTRFSKGMSVKLRCSRKQLDEWWRAVCGRSGITQSTQLASTFCEVAK